MFIYIYIFMSKEKFFKSYVNNENDLQINKYIKNEDTIEIIKYTKKDGLTKLIRYTEKNNGNTYTLKKYSEENDNCSFKIFEKNN